MISKYKPRCASSSTPHTARWPAALCFLVLVICSANATNAVAEDIHQRVADLASEVQILRQQLAQLYGAAGTDLTGLNASTLQRFVPSTANLQRTLATRTALWPQHWTFLSAVSADSRITSSHVMTDRLGGIGSALFVVLGDAAGWLYFFTPAGHLLHEYNTGVGAAATALASQLVRSNSSQLAMGLQDGTSLLLEVGHESVKSPDGSGIGFVTLLMSSDAAQRAALLNDTTAESHKQPIRQISFTKSPKQRKMLVLADASGRVVLLLVPSGRVMLVRQLGAPPLAVNLNTDYQMVVQTPHSAYIVLMHRGRSRIARPCSGLAPQTGSAAAGGSTASSQATTESSSRGSGSGADSNSSTGAGADTSGSESADNDVVSSSNSSVSGPDSPGQPDVLVAAVFDPVRSFRVFGVTSGGELVALVVPSSQRTNLCRVVQRLPLGLPPGPVRLVAAKGRLVLLHAAGVATFNITQPLKLAGSHAVSHTWRDMWQLYGLSKHYTQQQQQQQQQQGVVLDAPASQQQEGQEQLDAQPQEGHVSGSSDSSSSCSNSVLHTAAWDTDFLPAAAAGSVLLLPLGEKGLAAFAPAGELPAGSAGAGGSGVSGSGGAGFDVIKLVQPLVIVMMVVVGVWQFMRASNKHRSGQHKMRGMGAGYGSGLEGLGPEEMGQIGMAEQLFGGGASAFGGLDRDFGPYAGPRSNRERERARQDMFDPYGGLGALGARRRARQVMHGRPERGLASSGLGGGRRGAATGVSGMQQRGSAGGAHMSAGGSFGGSRGGAGSGGMASRSQAAVAGGGADHHEAGTHDRRVRFSDEHGGEDSGGDDVGRVPLPGAVETHEQEDAGGLDGNGQEVEHGVQLQGAATVGPGRGGAAGDGWESDSAAELLMQRMAAVGLGEGGNEQQER